MSTDHIIRVPRSDRGFLNYGETPLTCTYGSKVEVYESSSAEGPHVWLRIEEDSEILHSAQAGEATAHLNQEQAQEIIDRLQAWIDDIPERWQ